MHGARRIARARVPEHPSAVDQKRVANSSKPHVNLLAPHVARCRSESLKNAQRQHYKSNQTTKRPKARRER